MPLPFTSPWVFELDDYLQDRINSDAIGIIYNMVGGKNKS